MWPCGASLQLRRSWSWQHPFRLRPNTVEVDMRPVVATADSPRTAALVGDTRSAERTRVQASHRVASRPADHRRSVRLRSVRLRSVRLWLPVDSAPAASTASTVSTVFDSAATASEITVTATAAVGATVIPTSVAESIPTGGGMVRPTIRIRKSRLVWRMR